MSEQPIATRDILTDTVHKFTKKGRKKEGKQSSNQASMQSPWKKDQSWIKSGGSNASDGLGALGIPMSTPPPKHSPSSAAFKTPGFTIPTPMGAYKRQSGSTAEISPGSDSMVDDSAFLPDDFKRDFQQEKENTFTKVQVEQQIAAAIERAEHKWISATKRQLQAKIFEEMRQEAEQQLADHELMWAEERKQDIEKVKATLQLQQKTQKDYYEAQIKETNEKRSSSFKELVRRFESLEESTSSEKTQLQEQLMAFKISSSNSNDEIESLKAAHIKEMEEMQQMYAGQLEKEEKSRTDLILKHEQEQNNLQQSTQQQYADLMKSHEDFVKESQLLYAQQAEKEEEVMKEMTLKYRQELDEMQQQMDQQQEALETAHFKAVKEIQQSNLQELQIEIEAKKQITLKYEQKHDELQVQMTQERETDAETINELRNRLEKQMQQFDQDIQKHRDGSTQQLTDTIDKYEIQVANLEQDKEISLKTLREEITIQCETDTLRQKSEWQKDTTKQAEAAASAFVLQIEGIRKAAADDMTASEQRMEVRESEYRTQLEELTSKFDVERREIMDREEMARSEVTNLAGQIKLLSENTAELQIEIDEFKKLLQKSENELNNERTIFKQKEEDMWCKHKHELQQLREALNEQLEAERKAMETELHDVQASQQSQSDREKELLEKLSRLEIASRKEKDAFDTRVADVQKEHTVQIDEMLAQLDLIEAEHSERYSSLEESVDQKDAIISALGKQLAETTNRKTILEAEHETNVHKLKTTEEELTLCLHGTTELEATVDMLRAEKKEAVEDERKKGETICEKVRNETIAEAEAQFNTANEHYMTLKHEYDGAVDKISKLEKDLKLVRREVESAKSAEASRVAEVAADLAQSRAGKSFYASCLENPFSNLCTNLLFFPNAKALATAEATAARRVNEFRAKIEVTQAMFRDTQTKLDESNAARHATNLGLATLVTEKEKLIKENKDLNAVCEELMAMVEGGNLASE